LSTASTVYVLPDELEKHCIEAAPNVDKNGSASKKAAFAHLLLWICRRFSTVALVLQTFGWLNLSVWIQDSCQVVTFLSPVLSRRQEGVLLPCAGLGGSTFFL
jgi:hypothetical protein